MSDLEVLFCDETSIPSSTEILLLKGNLYLQQHQIEGEVLALKKIDDVVGMKTYAIIGDPIEKLGNFTIMNDSIYYHCFSYDIFRINEDKIISKNILDMFKAADSRLQLPSHFNREVYEFGNDGNYLYIDFSGDRLLVFDQEFNVIDFRREPGLSEDLIVPAPNTYFCPIDDGSWNKYKNGKLEKKLAIPKNKCFDISRAMAVSLARLITDEAEKWKSEIHEDKCDYATQKFSDGEELYFSTRYGHVFHIHEEKIRLINDIDSNEPNNILFTTNGTEAAAITDSSIDLYSKGKLISKNKLKVPLEKIAEATMDKNFIYFLAGDNSQYYCDKLLRYYILR